MNKTLKTWMKLYDECVEREPATEDIKATSKAKTASATESQNLKVDYLGLLRSLVSRLP